MCATFKRCVSLLFGTRVSLPNLRATEAQNLLGCTAVFLIGCRSTSD
jgi:hypothetical protein